MHRDGFPYPRCDRCYHSYTYSRRYGITLEEYEALLAFQGHCCATCNTPLGTYESGRQGKVTSITNMYVDHDHTTGLARGILCPRCNGILGVVGDDPAALRRLAEYLETPTVDRAGIKPDRSRHSLLYPYDRRAPKYSHWRPQK